MQHDTINLRNDADFRLFLGRGVAWVPVNRLGRSRYTNEELEDMACESTGSQIRDKRLNVYEAIQLYQMVRKFRECNDIVFFSYDGLEWQLHKSGRYAYETNEGCCATSAAWLNYIVEYTYPERGYLHFLRPDGSGHILNYILHGGKYYIIDMTTLTRENVKFVPVETGLKKEFASSKFCTGVFVESDSLMDYVNYHRRFQMTKGYEFSYLSKSSVAALSPSYSYVEKDCLHLLEFGKSYLLQMRNLHYESRQVPEGLKFPVEYTNDYV